MTSFIIFTIKTNIIYPTILIVTFVYFQDLSTAYSFKIGTFGTKTISFSRISIACS